MNIDNSLKGKLLIATPQMGDPRFERAVILVCEHDKNGAMGLVVNHPSVGASSHDLIDQLEITPVPGFKLDIYDGGPVDKSRGFVLHSEEYSQSDTVPVVEGFAVTGTVDALKAAAHGEGPENLRFALGYAGWTAGQLDAEMKQNAWLVVDADPEIVFKTPDQQIWEKAVERLGIDPAMLSTHVGRA